MQAGQEQGSTTEVQAGKEQGSTEVQAGQEQCTAEDQAGALVQVVIGRQQGDADVQVSYFNSNTVHRIKSDYYKPRCHRKRFVVWSHFKSGL